MRIPSAPASVLGQSGRANKLSVFTNQSLAKETLKAVQNVKSPGQLILYCCRLRH